MDWEHPFAAFCVLLHGPWLGIQQEPFGVGEDAQSTEGATGPGPLDPLQRKQVIARKCYLMTIKLGKKVFRDLIRSTCPFLWLVGMWFGILPEKHFVFSRNFRTIFPPIETYPKEIESMPQRYSWKHDL